MMILKTFFLFVAVIYSNVYAVEYIADQDRQRFGVFTRRYDECQVQQHTANISTRLTDHSNIDYSRTATVKERKIIYQAMMGSVIVHGDLFEGYTKAATGHSGYDSHFNALLAIDAAIRFLVDGVREGRTIRNIDDFNDPGKSLLDLTPDFVNWFNEVLESYCRPLRESLGAGRLGLIIGRPSEKGVRQKGITDARLKGITWLFCDTDREKNKDSHPALCRPWPDSILAKTLAGRLDAVVFEVGVENEIGTPVSSEICRRVSEATRPFQEKPKEYSRVYGEASRALEAQYKHLIEKEKQQDPLMIKRLARQAAFSCLKPGGFLFCHTNQYSGGQSIDWTGPLEEYPVQGEISEEFQQISGVTEGNIVFEYGGLEGWKKRMAITDETWEGTTDNPFLPKAAPYDGDCRYHSLRYVVVQRPSD